MAEVKNRDEFLDIIKGILILLVIIGHILPGTLQENPARYLIYSFHMPAFFFMNGYLLNVNSIKTSPLPEIAVKYVKRVAIPWLLAIQIYYLITHIGSYSIYSYAVAYVKPYYHLWYVIGFLFCIVTATVIIKADPSNYARDLIIAGIMIVLIYTFRLAMIPTPNILIDIVEYSVRPWHLLFFAIGVSIRNRGGVLRTAFTKASMAVNYCICGTTASRLQKSGLLV